MRTVVYMAIAANGAVANHQGDTPWGDASWENYIAAVDAAGNILMGRVTYDDMTKDPAVFDPGVKIVVVSSQPAPLGARAEFVASPQAALELLKDQPTVLVSGGPRLVTSMLEQNLIDEIHLDVEPIILGGGVPLIPARLERHLTLLDITHYDGGITLKYAVQKESTR
jgi:dihydrofolate reductase